MKKKFLQSLVICIFLSQFQGFTSVLANEVDRITLAPSFGRGLQEETQTIPEVYTGDAKTPVIAKEPEIEHPAKEFSDESEVVSKRTVNSKTYDLGNGNYVAEQFFEPIHTKENGKWEDIDNTIESKKTRSAIPSFSNDNGVYAFTYEENVMKITNEDDQSIEIRYPDADLQYLKTKENAMYFTNIYEDKVDLQTTLNNAQISQEYIFNEKSERNSIRFDLYTSLPLEKQEQALCVKDENQCAYTLPVPIIKDENSSYAKNITMDFEKIDDHYAIVITFDQEWMTSNERVYPIRSRSSFNPEQSLDIDGVYIRSNQPNVTSNYSQWFVGVEKYGLAMGENVGETRTFIDATIPSIGNNKVITDATLELYNEDHGVPANNNVEISTVNYTTVTSVKWANQPGGANSISTTSFSAGAGMKSFDITAFADSQYNNGKTQLLRLSGIGNTGANVFSSAGSTNSSQRPKISVSYRWNYDFDPDMSINSFDREFRVYTRDPDGFQALSFDGIAKPDSTVHFKLQEKQADGSFSYLKEFTATPSLYFLDPIYMTAPMTGVQDYTQAQRGNYTTDYIKASNFPYLDRFYNFAMSATKGSESSGVNYTDGFTLYKVKKGDTLRSIGAYYGIKVDTIIADNRLSGTTVKEEDVLFLRFLTDNPKLSPDAYRPPIRVATGVAKYIYKGPNCVGCRDLDPVNMADGNYHHTSTDFTLKDYDELSMRRTFNSTSEKTTSMFGNGWSTNYEQYLSRTSDGNILYYRGDGRIAQINAMRPDPSEKLQVTQVGNKIEIYDKAMNETYIFDEYDTLYQIRSKQGNLTTITYDDYGMITAMQVGTKAISFSYNAYHLVNQINLPNGDVVQYEYDGDRRLTLFRDEAGYTETYSYDGDGQITAVKDKVGNLLGRNTYDAEGKVLQQIDAIGNTSKVDYSGNSVQVSYPDNTSKRYEHNAENNISKITDENGHSRSFSYDARNNITSEVNENNETIQYEYDGNDNLTRKQNPDGTYEQYSYDANSNMLSKRNVDGTSESFSYDANGNMQTHAKDNEKTITYQYDSQNRVIQKVDDFVTTMEYSGPYLSKEIRSDGLIKTYQYDVKGNITLESENTGKFTSYVYNKQNLVITQSDNQGTQQFGYDANGNVTSYIDKKGALTTTTYDALNRPTTIVKGSLRKELAYDVKGNLASEKNEQGITITYTYDAAGNKQSESKHGQTTRYTYDNRNRLIRTDYPTGVYEEKHYVYDNMVEERNTHGQITKYEYDGLNRPTKTIYPNGTSEIKSYTGNNLTTEIATDGTEKTYAYDTKGNVLTTQERKGNEVITTNNTYDYRSRLITSTTHGVSTTTTYDIYDNPLEVRVNGQATTNTYDINNQLLTTTNPLNETTSYAYDEMGNQIRIIYPDASEEAKTYNQLNQLEKETDVLGNSTINRYNTLGQLSTRQDQNGVITTYTYDEYGNIATTSINGLQISKDHYDALGRKIEEERLTQRKQYQYNAYGEVEKESDLTKGIVTLKTYDAYGNLLTERDNVTKNIRNEYDAKQRLIKTTDSYGREATKRYDNYGRVVSQTSPEGITTTNTYDTFGNIKTQTDGQGNITSYTYDIYQNKVREETPLTSQSYTYDVLQRPLTTTDEGYGKTSTTTYDSVGNVKTQSDLLGNTTTYVYDKKKRKIQETSPSGAITKTEYDMYDNVTKITKPDGTVTKTTYNVYGQKLQEEDERHFVTTYEYNHLQQLTKVQDKLNGITTLKYDARNNPIETILDNGGVFKQRYDVYDRVIEEEDPNGRITKTRYDALGNITQKEEPYKIIKHTYDERGRLVETKENERILETNTYDAYNQLKEKQDAIGQKTTYEYDKYGRQTYVNEKGNETTSAYDDHGNLIEETNNERVYTYTYDVLGRQLTKKQGTHEQSRQEYDQSGNITLQSEKGIVKKQSYDIMNRLIEEKQEDEHGNYVVTKHNTYDASGNLIEEKNGTGDTIQYTYDANNNQTSKTDGNGNQTKYAYDTLNAITKLETPQGRVVHYTYDLVGNKTKEIFNAQQTRYTYDDANRLIKEEDKAGTEKTEYDVYGNVSTFTKKDGKIITSEYDSLNRLIKQNERTYAYNAQDKQIEATNEQGTLTMEYDIYGNIIESVDPNRNVVTYTYDEYGNKTSITYPNKETVDYTYNEQDQLLQVEKGERIVAQYQYDQRGNVIQLIQDNVINTYAYDNANRTIKYHTTKDGQTISERAYQFDGNGNVIKESIDGKENQYTYNENDELKTSSKNIDGEQVATTYSIDMYGNRVEKRDNGTYSISQYNDKNQLTKIDSEEGSTYLHYDEIGNIASIYYDDGFKEHYAYDDFGQLTQIENNEDKIITYTYDGTGERITSTLKDEETYQVKSYYTTQDKLDLTQLREELTQENIDATFDAVAKQAEVKQANGNKCTVTTNHYTVEEYKNRDAYTEYVVDYSQEFSQVLMENADTSVYGLTRLETEDTKYISGLNETVTQTITSNKVTNIEYDDYGYTKDNEKGYGYNGEQKDPTGLIYLRARYYNPKLGRFIQIDPYKGNDTILESKNRYTFVYNNPYKYVDKSGNEPLDGDDDYWKPQQYGSKNAKNKLLQAAWAVKEQNKQRLIDNGSYKGQYTSEVKMGFGKAIPRIQQTRIINPIIIPCPPKPNPVTDFINGIGKGIGEIAGNALQGIGNVITRPNMMSPNFIMDNSFAAKEQMNGIAEAMKSEKFWYQIGVTVVAGVATLAVGGLLLLSPITVTGLGIAGTTGAVVSVTHSVSGQYYDYDVTYGRDLQQMLEAEGYNSIEELFGYNMVKQLFNGAAGYATGKSIYSFGKGASGAGASYDSFNAFKKANPVKTQGNQWHHIVEQNQAGKSGFSVQQINNTNNLIELTPTQHSQLSGFYSSKPDFTGGLTVRDWLAGQSFETQYKFGIDKLKEFGFMK